MNRRIFIAINLHENLKKKLSECQEKWPELPARWTKMDNLHITLLFIGSVADQEIAEICQISKEVALRHPTFSISLNKICYGPPNNAEAIYRADARYKMPPRPPKFLGIDTVKKDKTEPIQKFGWPRMVWIEGEKSEELTKLQKDLENALFTPSFKALSVSEIRLFAPHITLGRIRQWEFRRIEPEERPEVEEDVSLNLQVNSIEVMESRLKRGGAEYTILESAPLADSKNF